MAEEGCLERHACLKEDSATERCRWQVRDALKDVSCLQLLLMRLALGGQRI